MRGAEARLPHPVGLAPQLEQGLRGGPTPQGPPEKKTKNMSKGCCHSCASTGSGSRPEQDRHCSIVGVAAQGPADWQSRQLSGGPMLTSGAGG